MGRSHGEEPRGGRRGEPRRCGDRRRDSKRPAVSHGWAVTAGTGPGSSDSTLAPPPSVTHGHRNVPDKHLLN